MAVTIRQGVDFTNRGVGRRLFSQIDEQNVAIAGLKTSPLPFLQVARELMFRPSDSQTLQGRFEGRVAIRNFGRNAIIGKTLQSFRS